MKNFVKNPFFWIVISAVFNVAILPELEKKFELVDQLSELAYFLEVGMIMGATALYYLKFFLKSPVLIIKVIFALIYGSFFVVNTLLASRTSDYLIISSSFGTMSLAFIIYVILVIKKTEESNSTSTTKDSSTKSTSDYSLYLKTDAKKTSIAIYIFIGWTILILNYVGLTIEKLIASLQQSYTQLYILIGLWLFPLIPLLIWYLRKKEAK